MCISSALNPMSYQLRICWRCFALTDCIVIFPFLGWLLWVEVGLYVEKSGESDAFYLVGEVDSCIFRAPVLFELA